MRIFIILSFLSSFFFIKKPNQDEFLKKCISPTVTIINKKAQTTGTGFIVRSKEIAPNLFCNIILSCEHVTANKLFACIHEYEDSYFHKNEKIQSAITIGKNKDYDISVLMFISKIKLNEAKLSFDKNLKLKQKVFTVGCGLGDNPRFSDGYITDLTPSKNNLQNIRTSVCMVPGDSGAALFNENNEVIGIASFIRTMTRDNKQFPVPNISNFKSIQLFEKIFKDGKYDFIFEQSKMPLFLSDYLWLTDSELHY
jgi:S1-C subfamily serine protease